MWFWAYLRWGLFLIVFSLLAILPMALLWGELGLSLGVFSMMGFLFALSWRATPRLARQLGASELSRAEAPFVHCLVEEYCRRIGISEPKLGLIESKAMNVGIVGFSPNSALLMITRGALDHLKREELSALISRELVPLWNGDVFCRSWLSLFLSVVDPLFSPSRSMVHGHRLYSLDWFFKQVLVYPLIVIAVYFLSPSRNESEWDLKAVKLNRIPRPFVEALRKIEASKQRFPFVSPFSARPLFLVYPVGVASFANLLFESPSLMPRIRDLEQLGVSKAPA